MIDVSNKNVSRHFLFLEMAFQTKRGIAFGEQALVHGAVRRMTNGAPLPQCLVLINKWAALRGVTLKAGFVSAQESQAAGFERLLNIWRRAFDCDPLVRLVTIGAAHFAFEYRMVMRQGERCANFQVTLETRLRRFARIDDRVRRAAAFHVQTTGPMTRLATDVLRVLSLRFQSCVRRCSEVARDPFVACGAFLGADELRAGNAGWRKNCSVGGAAGQKNDGKRGCSSSAPQHGFALAVNPSS